MADAPAESTGRAERRRADRRSGGDRRALPQGEASPHLGVVTISEAFGDFWDHLAEDFGLTVRRLGPEDVSAHPKEMVALIVAAGGAEQAAIEWLSARRGGRGPAMLVVGTDPGRRTAMQIVSRGAADYFSLPDDLEVLRNVIEAEIESHAVRAPDRPSPSAAFSAIVGRSEAMRQVLDRATRLLPHRNARVLILGETGTGKELLARAIHAGGPRRDAAFVTVNCSAFPEHLIESELFGHERGAFTDAHAAKPGLFEIADGGTLLLDEVGELPLGMQAKMLRVLEEREIRRVGGTKGRLVDVRVLAATHEDLASRVREGTFREDLLYRLSTVTLTLPPLRERGDDLEVVANALLEQLAREHDLPVMAPTAELLQRLRDHTWPGNIRELKNALERARLLSPPGELRADEIELASQPAQAAGPLPFPASLRDISSAAAHAMVAACGGNRSEAARRLDISSRRLRRLLAGDGPEDDGDDAESPELDGGEATRIELPGAFRLSAGS